MKPFYIPLLLFYSIVVGLLNPLFSQDPIPEHETFTIPSKILNETRIITVWIPDSYKSNSEDFPVMYMADGGIKEDFPHVALTIDKLIKEGKIEPMLLVGVENTQRRRDLTGFTDVRKEKKLAPNVGGSENFRQFIREELFPEIKKRYRITEQRSIIGESASGLFVIETFLLHPDMFDAYIAFDPSLWWNNSYLVKSAEKHLEKFPKTKKKLWFASSSAGDIVPQTKKLSKILKNKNLDNIIWNYSDEPQEKHTTIFRATKEKALIWTFNSSK